MALSKRSKDIIEVALADRKAAKELADALAAAANAQGAAVADLAAYAAVTGVDGTGSNAASKADVDARFTAVYAKLNALLASLRNAGLIA